MIDQPGIRIGRQAFDSLIQHKAPDATRGRLLARFETGFQLAWARAYASAKAS